MPERPTSRQEMVSAQHFIGNLRITWFPPKQPWLDGFAIGKASHIRQFVVTPLSESYSVEEQSTNEGEYGLCSSSP